MIIEAFGIFDNLLRLWDFRLETFVGYYNQKL